MTNTTAVRHAQVAKDTSKIVDGIMAKVSPLQPDLNVVLPKAVRMFKGESNLAFLRRVTTQPELKFRVNSVEHKALRWALKVTKAKGNVFEWDNMGHKYTVKGVKKAGWLTIQSKLVA